MFYCSSVSWDWDITELCRQQQMQSVTAPDLRKFQTISMRGQFLWEQADLDAYYRTFHECVEGILTGVGQSYFFSTKPFLMPVATSSLRSQQYACTWSMVHSTSYLGDFDSRSIARGEPAANEADFVQG